MPNILDEIVEQKKTELASAKRVTPQSDLESACRESRTPVSFYEAIETDVKVSLIAEVKKASPSKGLIRADFDPVAIAKTYSENGARCISVLTDEKYFQGHLDFLRDIARAVPTPLLRKDFVIDPYQIYEARLAGASAVLLIAECLEPSELKDLHDLIVEMEMTPLVEFHEASNLEMTLNCGAKLIGVNNRDLKTFHTDLNHVINMIKEIPSERIVVAESGIFSPDDVERISDAGIDAMLVGESLMRQQNIGEAVKHLLSGNP